jgi:hypothetical protein
LIVVVVAIAGCAGDSGHGSGSSSSDARGAAAAHARFPGWRTDFARHAVPLTEFFNGGPPRDGIPPIDHPKPVTVERGDRVFNPREPVIAVTSGGAARAYPIEILVWHEIVNDTLAGKPIAVTYCPLCNSSVVFDRRVGGRTLTFGTTGKLRNSDLVMWDRQTQSWWQQFTGAALVGSLMGTHLTELDSQVLSWAQFKARYPNGTVLSRNTGFDRPYGASPYPGYEKPNSAADFYQRQPDPRLPPKERVAAVFAPHQTVVVPFSRLARTPVVTGSAAGQPFVVLYTRGVVSALDMNEIPDSIDVGTAAAFDPRVGRRTLSFRPAGGGSFADGNTGSRWDITGRAVAGRLRGTQLRPLRHDEQYWFALAAFVPHARLIGP